MRSGVVRSHLLPPWLRVIKPLISRDMVDVERGTRTTLYLALDESAGRPHGAYLDEHQRVRAVAPLAASTALQEALWSASSRWVDLAENGRSVASGINVERIR